METLSVAGLGAGLSIFTLIFLAWSFAWKGWALWIAARKNEKWWYIGLLVINTVGILEILYIFWISKKDWSKKEKDETISKEEIEREVEAEKKENPASAQESNN